jgi:GNAT superfamily N-acetyltransferase
VTRSALSAPEQLLRADVRLVTCSEQACALSITHENTAGIYWVGTVPAARGRGLARNCVLSLADHAWGAGARCVVVQAGQGLEGFYASLGFERLSELRLYTNLDAPANLERSLQ